MSAMLVLKSYNKDLADNDKEFCKCTGRFSTRLEDNRKMKRADYEIVRVEEDKVFIVDLDLGNISVTNNAAEVYLEINNNFPNRRLIYRDTLGNWDEIIVTGKENIYMVDFAPYEGHIPDKIEITGCPSSSLIQGR